MTAFGPDRAGDLLAQCQSASEAIGNAFSVAFGGEFQARTAEPTQRNPDELAANLAGSGLIFDIAVGDTACLAVLNQADGSLPDWCVEPDSDGDQKLRQLGIELLTAMFPPDSDHKLVGITFHRDLPATMRQAKPSDQSTCLPLEVVQGESIFKLSLIWPVAHFTDTAATAPSAKEENEENEENVASNKSQPSEPGKLPKHRRLIYRNLEEGIRQLPAYAQSLLRVQVPVTVTLASANTSVSKILDMGPGTILQFKKACDSNLTLEVGSQKVAEGEAVKVGDKFGLWITSMTMPSERFWSVNKSATSKRVK